MDPFWSCDDVGVYRLVFEAKKNKTFRGNISFIAGVAK